MTTKPVLVLLSGGQDSTTALFWAKREFGDNVHALTIGYGQRHAREIQAADTVGAMAGVRSHEKLVLGSILKSTSPLVSDQPVGQYASAEVLPGGIEPTFVPCRNALFLVLAANRAAAIQSVDIVIGVCEADYGGYPDCREEFCGSMQLALGDALGIGNLSIHRPLMHMTKAQTVELAQSLPGCMEALAYSHTCYNGEYPPNPFNHASILRARGFRDAGVGDPLILRAKSEGLLPVDYPDSGYVSGTPYELKR